MAILFNAGTLLQHLLSNPKQLRRAALLSCCLLTACGLWAEAPADQLFAPPSPYAHLDLSVEYEFHPSAAEAQPRSFRSLASRIAADHRCFYDADTLTWLAAGVGTHAVISNTNVDEYLRHEYQERIRSTGTDEWTELFHSPKLFGEGSYLLPAYAALALTAIPFDEDSLVGRTGEWGERSLRTVLVGAPPVLGLQLLIGASRPLEEHSQSHWEPFQDDNGVSGHAFMGAIPFLSAARMTEQPHLKAALYLGSTMPALSRVNDDAHYASQAMLGWTIAYLASSAVDDAYDSAYKPMMIPGPVAAEGTGVNILWRF